jgi:cystathionine beta-lyase/cystathionine gamma-synthase
MVVRMKGNTRVNHPRRAGLPADNRALVSPIYQSVKFTLDSVLETERLWRGERDGFYYSRSANPTLRELEQLLADLQGRDACVLTASGVAALAVPLLSLCKQGDHVLMFVESYNPTRYLVQQLLGKFGVAHTLLSIEDLDGIDRVLIERSPRLVVFESPTNPVTKIANIQRLTAAAKRAGALTLLDNTFAGFHNHGQFDIDVYAHSLTKYASGHGDVMGGAVIARKDLIQRIRLDASPLGATLDPHAAFLIQRGMKTYFLRYERQCKSAQAIAEFLAAHPRVLRVAYPGLTSHPQHALARAQMHDFGTVVTFDLNGGFEHSSRFAESLQLFSIAPSLGSTESLAMPAKLFQGGRDFTPAQKKAAGIAPGTVRLSVGIEDIDDLLTDLNQALDLARQVNP